MSNFNNHRVVPNEKRFWEYVNKTETCWLWTAHVDNGGYGRFGLRLGKNQWKSNYLAHRYSYELVNGEIPKELTVDHICKIRNCVNPDHLRLMTLVNNIKAGNAGIYNQVKKFCPKGHSYSGENLLFDTNSSRTCRMCRRNSWKQYRQRVLQLAT